QRKTAKQCGASQSSTAEGRRGQLSGHYGHIGVPRASKPRPLPIAASRGSVTSFPRQARGTHALSALAGDGDVFVAATVLAISRVFWNRSGDFVWVNAAVRGSESKITRLAIGTGSIGTAFLALGQALVDSITVGMVGDNEDLSFGERGGCDGED